MIALAGVDMFVHVFFLKVEESTRILGIATNEVLKRFGPHLCNQCNAAVEFKEISHLESVANPHFPSA